MLDSPQVQGAVRKAIAAVVGFLVALILLLTLLIGGIYLLGKAATLAMAPYLGEPGALAATGLVCLLFLVAVFYRLTRPAARRSSQRDAEAGSSPNLVEALREVIRENPVESAFTAFAVGVVEQSDPRLKSLLLDGGVALLKQREAEAQADPERERPDSDVKSDP